MYPTEKELSRETLLEEIKKGRIITIQKFHTTNWPKDHLMSHLRFEISNEVNSFLRTNSVLCDPLDLQFQTLFRSSTYKPEELFYNGNALHKYLKENKVFDDWRNILRLSQSRVRNFKVDKEKLRVIVEEQYQIIERRLNKSTLPLNDLFNTSRMFNGNGWHIKREMGLIYATGSSRGKDLSIPLTFSEVNLDLAVAIFRDLHYIHTPRVEIAFGLSVSGESLPFSVIGASRIDRKYKKDALLIQGYDYDKCLDITRLYNVRGSPANTSTVMLSQAVRYLKITYPKLGACLTAVTPSFSEGKSIAAGGFFDPVMVRPLTVTFGQAHAGSKTYLERLTERRLIGYKGPRITNQIPLLPVLELMRRTGRRDYMPLIEDDVMVLHK